MIKGIEAVNLSTQSAKALAKFYKEKVGLKIDGPWEMGDKGEEAYEIKLKGASIYILDHNKIKGKNKQGARTMINLEVDKIEPEVKRLKKNKVKQIAPIYHMEGYGWISTFEDIDGNYFQLVQVKAS